MNEAYVSLVTNDAYANGAVVLVRSLRNTNTTRKLVLLVTSHLSQQTRAMLSELWDELVDSELLESSGAEPSMNRPELKCTFTKLVAWKLVQYTKCVFLDADTMVLQNIDDLFTWEEFSAAPDIGWPDCFNSGVFVFQPSIQTYDSLVEFVKTCGSFDGGDQGLLNDFFSDWATSGASKRLPFTYNMVSNVCYTYAPAFKRYGSGAKVVHFLGASKPWHQKTHQPVRDDIFNKMWQEIRNEPTTSAAENNLPSWSQWEGYRSLSADDQRRYNWQAGYPDYRGADSSDGILEHLKNTILTAPATVTEDSPKKKEKDSDKIKYSTIVKDSPEVKDSSTASVKDSSSADSASVELSPAAGKVEVKESKAKDDSPNED